VAVDIVFNSYPSLGVAFGVRQAGPESHDQAWAAQGMARLSAKGRGRLQIVGVNFCGYALHNRIEDVRLSWQCYAVIGSAIGATESTRYQSSA
jgi:hypothetical protein